MASIANITRHFIDGFRQASGEVVVPHRPLDPVRTVAGFGALQDKQGVLARRDKYWRGYTQKACDLLGLLVAADFAFIPVNLKDGKDLLDPRFHLSAQVLASCYVPNPDLVKDDPFSKDPRFASAYATSPFHSKTAYREAAENIGAFLVVTFSYEREICSHDFVGKDYIKGPRWTCDIPEASGQGQANFLMATAVRKDLAGRLGLH